MSLELLKPVSENLLDELDENYSQGSLFKKIKFHRQQSGIPDISLSNLLNLLLFRPINSAGTIPTSDKTEYLPPI